MIGGWSSYYGADAIRWWPDVDGSEFDGSPSTPRHEKLIPAAYLVWMRNAARRAQWFYYARLYGGFDQALAGPIGGLDPISTIPGSAPYNVIRSTTNTLTAKVIKNRPSPYFLPVDADSKLRKRVQYLNRFSVGLLRKHAYYRKRHIQVRDAGLFGTGHLLVARDRRRISIENLLPWEVNVDPSEARYNDPRTLYLIRFLDKGVLKMRYPKHADDIESAPVLDEAFQPVSDVFAMSNRCTVVEAIHLPSGPGALDGRRTVCLLDATLSDKRYDRPDFPISRLVKDPSISGWWGLGMGDELSGFQDRISMMDERLEYAHRTVGGQFWLVPEGSQMLDADFTDDIGVTIRHTPGLPPVAVNPEPVNEQTYDYFRQLIVDPYSFSGVSTMSAQSQKPAGVTAALALQTLDDIETDRFIGFQRDDEECVLDTTRLALHEVREVARRYGDFEVLSAGRGAGEKILWKRDVDLEEDSYVAQEWAISLLPKTPAAKLQRLLELGANGYFDKPTVLRYMELPDTTQEEALMLSPRDVCDAQIAAMLSHEDPFSEQAFLPPSEHQDCDYALQRADAFYNKISADAVDKGTWHDPLLQRRLRNLDKYMQLAKAIVDKAKAEAAALQAQAAAAQAAPAAPGGPTAQPASPQTISQPISPNAPVAPAPALAAS